MHAGLRVTLLICTATALTGSVPPRPAYAAGSIAFVRGGNIWTAGVNGQNQKRLTTSGDCHQPSWSPDGRKLVYVRGTDRGTTLWLLTPSAGTASRLAKTLSCYVCPRWSPDGKWIACLDDNRAPVTEGPHPVRLIKLSPTNGKTTAVKSGIVGGNALAWSPDSKRIAYAFAPEECRSAIAVVSASDGRTVRARLYTIGRDDTPDVGIGNLNWLAAGQIAFTYYWSRNEGEEDQGIRQVSLSGGASTLWKGDVGSMSVGRSGLWALTRQSELWLLKGGTLAKLVDDARDVSCF